MDMAWLLAVGAGAATVWAQLRAWGTVLLSVVWVRTEVEMPGYIFLLRYLRESGEFVQGRLGQRMFSAMHDFVRPAGRREWVGVEMSGQSLLFWRGWGLLSFRQNRTADGAYGARSVVVGHLRGAFDVEHLLHRAIQAENAQSAGHVGKRRFRLQHHFGTAGERQQHAAQISGAPQPTTDMGRPEVQNQFRVLHWKPEDIGAPMSEQPFEGLYYPQAVESALKQVRRWHQAKAFYQSRHIPWRLGALLYGPPGTGKTSFVRAVAEELDLPVHVFDLSTMNNRELRNT
jgi:hypothetical protein